MKKLRKVFFIVLTLGIVLLFGACDNALEGSSDKSLYEHGLDLISLLKEMAGSEAYIGIYIGGDEEISTIVANAAKGDYTKPKAVYQIMISEDKLLKLLDITDTDMEGLSDTLKEYIKQRLQNSITSLINSSGGTNMIAASSICTAGKTFVSAADEHIGNVIYLYTYENAIPVIVTFVEGENGAVSASGSLIFNEDFMTDTEQKVEQFFADFADFADIGVELKEIKE